MFLCCDFLIIFPLLFFQTSPRTQRWKSWSGPAAPISTVTQRRRLSLLCAKRLIRARGSSNRYRSSVGMFLDFFYGSKMRKAKKKKKKDLMVAAKNRERKVCFLIFLYFLFFYGFEMIKAGRKKKKKKRKKE